MKASIRYRDGLVIAGFVFVGWLAPAAPAAAFSCPGTPPSPPPSGVCSVTAGSGARLLQGTVLGPGEVLENGQVLVGSDGIIECVACDCGDSPEYAGATRIECPQGVISPGLIDTNIAMTFQANAPYVNPDGERYEHRNDWRTGANGHTQVGAVADTSLASRQYGELRAVMAGVTSLVGNAAATAGFARNLDHADADAIGVLRTDPTRFPLGDSGGEQLDGSCAYGALPLIDGAEVDLFTFGEGIDRYAHNEWRCVSGEQGGGTDVIADLPVAGLLSLDADDAELLSRRGTSLLWSPRHSVFLYGHPGPVASLARLGVPIALGSFWPRTGSMTLLRELGCADTLNRDHLGDVFSDRDLWLMATRNGARALKADAHLGALDVGRRGDVAVFDGREQVQYRAVIEATADDVVLVLRDGRVLYGDDALVVALGGTDAECESFSLCSTHAKRACVQRETGQTLAVLQASAAGAAYPLGVCGTPPDEPTCTPSRPAAVNGSSVYTGLPGPGDQDGDGVPDFADNCPATFNPIRPIDNGAQADVDADGLGDDCDGCPVEAGDGACLRTVFADGFEPI